MNGDRFLGALERIGYPKSKKLDGNSLDWLFEDDRQVPLLEWFSDNIQSTNVLQPTEMSEFDNMRTSCEGILKGSQLQEALHNLSLINNEELSDDRIEAEIQQLEQELKFSQKRKEMHIQQRNQMSHHQSALNRRVGQMDGVLTVTKNKYTKRLEQSQADNAKMNESMEELVSSVQQLMKLYLAGCGPLGKEVQEAVFLSHIHLEPYHIAEEKYTQELTAFTKKQFFQGIADMVGDTQGSQYELLEVSNPVSLLVSGEREGVNMDDCKELGRLQMLYPKCEADRINAHIESRCTVSACRYAEDRLKSLKIKPYPQNVKELSAKLQDAQSSLSVLKRDLAILGETKLPSLIKDSATLQVAKVLKGDYMLKIARQDYFTRNQDQVITQLVLQRARNEYLTMAYELELKSHRDMHRLLTATTMLLQKNLLAQVDRLKMMEEGNQGPTKYRRGTVDSRDKFITRLYQILSPSEFDGKQQIFLTYQDLSHNADKLRQDVTSLRTALTSTHSIQDDRLSLLESNMKACQTMVYAESSTVGGLPVLSPRPIIDLITQLNDMLKRLEQAVYEIIQDIDNKKKKLKLDPLQAMERDLFAQFFTNPDELRRSVNEVTARVQAMLLK